MGSLTSVSAWYAAAGFGEVRLPGPDNHRLVASEVADRDHAPGDDSQRTVAAVAYPPFGSAHSRRREVTPGAEMSLRLAPEETEDASAELRRLGLLPLRRAHRALEPVLDHQVGQAFERALLDNLETEINNGR